MPIAIVAQARLARACLPRRAGPPCSRELRAQATQGALDPSSRCVLAARSCPPRGRQTRLTRIGKPSDRRDPYAKARVPIEERNFFPIPETQLSA
jgi:hypothetical protein